jgi:hypothetical protein
MDTHKKLFKPTRHNPTLSERVRKGHNERKATRNDRFAANRKIE